jgi:hypothetical protein
VRARPFGGEQESGVQILECRHLTKIEQALLWTTVSYFSSLSHQATLLIINKISAPAAFAGLLCMNMADEKQEH